MDRLWTPWRYQYITKAAGSSRTGVPIALDAYPHDNGCVFCNLIGAVRWATQHGTTQADAERAGNILFQGEHCYLCLNAFPYSSGHVLIVPYVHESSLASLAAPIATEMMHLAQRVETALRLAYCPDGINMGLNLGEAAGAGVAAHLHLHILPRWSGDANFMTVVGETRVIPEALETTWERLRQVLDLPAPDSATADISNDLSS